MFWSVGRAVSKLVLPLLIVGFAVGAYLIGKSLHHAGNEAGSVLVSPIGRAGLAAAESNLESADRAAQSYYADNVTYVGMSTASLQQDDPGTTVQVVQAGATSYCLQTTISDAVAHLDGPNGLPTAGPC